MTLGVIGTASVRAAYDADLVREAGPDGAVVVHAIMRSSRVIDRLYRGGLINDDQWEAGTALRDLWERALRAAKAEARGQGPGRLFADPEAFEDYQAMMAGVDPGSRVTLRAVVIADEDPGAFGRRARCDGLTATRRALDALIASSSGGSWS
jgi:hypothetical protein